VSKILERLVLVRLRPQLLTSPNFARLQSAYRCGHSAETALLHIMNSMFAAADNKKATKLVGLDIWQLLTRSTTALCSALSAVSLASMLKFLPGCDLTCRIDSCLSDLGNMLLTQNRIRVVCPKGRYLNRYFLWRTHHQSAT